MSTFGLLIFLFPPDNGLLTTDGPSGPAAGFKPLPHTTGWRRRQGGLRRKAHPEPLPSFADRKASRAFHHHPDGRPGLPLHYQCRDYAPLQSRPPCHTPPAGVGGRVVCGAKRIRSLYLPSPTERPPGLSTTTPTGGPASLSTINAATMRLCRADLPVTHHPFAAASPQSRLQRIKKGCQDNVSL
jgi:hypothetical protein